MGSGGYYATSVMSYSRDTKAYKGDRIDYRTPGFPKVFAHDPGVRVLEPSCGTVLASAPSSSHTQAIDHIDPPQTHNRTRIRDQNSKLFDRPLVMSVCSVCSGLWKVRPTLSNCGTAGCCLHKRSHRRNVFLKEEIHLDYYPQRNYMIAFDMTCLEVWAMGVVVRPQTCIHNTGFSAISRDDLDLAKTLSG